MMSITWAPRRHFLCQHLECFQQNIVHTSASPVFIQDLDLCSILPAIIMLTTKSEVILFKILLVIEYFEYVLPIKYKSNGLWNLKGYWSSLSFTCALPLTTHRHHLGKVLGSLGHLCLKTVIWTCLYTKGVYPLIYACDSYRWLCKSLW